jgi:hypothetical protein
MPASYQPAIQAQSAPLGTSAPFDSTSPFGATIPLGSQPARLDARSMPLEKGIPVGFQPEVPGLFSPADSAIPLTPRPARLDPTAPRPSSGGPANPATALDPTAQLDSAALGGPFNPASSLDPSALSGSGGPHDPAAPLDAPAAAPEPLRVVPRASGAGAQVHPGSRLGPVAAFIELQLSSAPASPAPAPPTPAPPRGLVERASIWPTAAAGPPPLDVSSTPVPPPAADDADPDGLARRVPGTHLPAALRRDAAGPPADADGGRDADRVRAMLSRFQASQNAGRVAADTPPPRPPEENP